MGEVKHSTGCGCSVDVCFYLLFFIGFPPYPMLAKISKIMFFLYNVPCFCAIVCQTLRQKLPLSTKISSKRIYFLLGREKKCSVRPVGHLNLVILPTPLPALTEASHLHSCCSAPTRSCCPSHSSLLQRKREKNAFFQLSYDQFVHNKIFAILGALPCYFGYGFLCQLLQYKTGTPFPFKSL